MPLGQAAQPAASHADLMPLGQAAQPTNLASGASRGGMLPDLAAGVRQGGGSLLTRLRALPRRARWGAGAGLAAALVIGIVTLSSAFGGSSAKSTATRPSTTASPTGPPFAVSAYQDSRHFSLNVPAGWTRVGSTFIDFTDPRDSGRRMRINVEPAGHTNAEFIAAVERQQQSDANRCATPFHQLALRQDVRLAGRPAAELEYTCGDGPDLRHIIWRATVINKQAYEFYLSVPDSQFAASKPIYDEAVRSYALNISG